MLAVSRSALALCLVVSGVARAEGGDVEEKIKPYVAAVDSCTKALIKTSYKEILDRTIDDTVTFDGSAYSYCYDRKLDFRDGSIPFDWMFYREAGGNPYPELSFYIGQNGSAGGAIYGKEFNVIAWFQGIENQLAPHLVYRTKVLSYEIDRFGRVVNLVEELNGVRMEPRESTGDSLSFFNVDTSFPMGFQVSGMAQYRECILAQVRDLPEFEE